MNFTKSFSSSGSTRSPPPDTPDSQKRLADALQLLSLYADHNPAVDTRDTDRLRAATAAPLSATLPAPASGGGAHPSIPGGNGKGDSRLRELQRRIVVSDAIMKRLHAKNKALQGEVAALREELAAQGGAAHGPVGAPAPRGCGPSSGTWRPPTSGSGCKRSSTRTC